MCSCMRHLRKPHYRSHVTNLCQRKLHYRSHVTNLCQRKPHYGSHVTNLCQRKLHYRSHVTNLCQRKPHYRSHVTNLCQRKPHYRSHVTNLCHEFWKFCLTITPLIQFNKVSQLLYNQSWSWAPVLRPKSQDQLNFVRNQYIFIYR
jgi:hypothetical protein